MRLITLVALVTVCLLTACGGDSPPPAAPGSAEKPLVAKMPDAAATAAAPGSRRNESQAGSGHKDAAQPGYKALVENQSSKPKQRFTPCNLVSPAQARAIVGKPLQAPVEAPQGPTCIYRTRTGDGFFTLAVQSVKFEQLKRRIRGPQQVSVSSRTAYCGKLGQPMLYVPLSRGRVLSIAAPCAVARRFALAAVPRLPS
jgi:hypothetical protein